MRELGVGVVGAGAMGAVHVALLSGHVAGARLAGVYDPDPARGGTHAGAEALVADPAVDAVVVASPSEHHEPVLLACLAAGKRVLCEKPLADTAESSGRIAAAEAERRERLIQVGFMRRFDPHYADLARRLGAGEIGAPLLVHCAHRNAGVPSGFDAEAALTDSVAHEVDILRWLLGDEIAAVTVVHGRPGPRAPAGVADPLFVLFETAGGAVAGVESFLRAGYGYDIRCEVVGEHGTLALPRVVTPGYRERFADAYRAQLQAFCDAVRAGAEPPGATVADGLTVARVTAAAVRALRRGARETV